MSQSLFQDDDSAVDEVVAHLERATKGEPAGFFTRIVRQGVDEVIDGPRTGRWDFEQLEKTEKTYVGTKIEILIRAALELERGEVLDVEIAGHDVDIKWSMTSVWQIPREAVGKICLCVGGVGSLRAIKVGVVRCTEDRLNVGKNQDGKKTLSSHGRSAMTMLVEDEPLPPNFVAEMDPQVREEISSHKTIQGRITALAKAVPYVPIPRDAIRTFARTEGDPIRRTRADKYNGDPLDGMELLSAKYKKATIEALGLPPLGKDEFMAVPKADLEALAVSEP